jgi:hypothetical protein
MHIQFNLKDPMYTCFAQKTLDIQSKSKDAMYSLDETQSISNFSTIEHNFLT